MGDLSILLQSTCPCNANWDAFIMERRRARKICFIGPSTCLEAVSFCDEEGDLERFRAVLAKSLSANFDMLSSWNAIDVVAYHLLNRIYETRDGGCHRRMHLSTER